MNQGSAEKAKGSLMYLMLLTTVAALGGLLFGYDTAVISGAVGFLQAHFQLGAGLKGWAASSALIGGSIVQVIALAAVGIMFAKGVGGLWLLIFIVMFTAAFASAMGPVPWIVISEIFPTKIRGRAMSMAVLVLWASCYIVSQTFPMLVDAIGNAKTFWIYALCSLAGLIFVVLMVPVFLPPKLL